MEAPTPSSASTSRSCADDVLKAASGNYGPRSVILLPGRRLEQEHDRAPAQEGLGTLFAQLEGGLYTFRWTNLPKPASARGGRLRFAMHEEPLKLIPLEWREKAIERLHLSNEKYGCASTASSIRRAASSSRG